LWDEFTTGRKSVKELDIDGKGAIQQAKMKTSPRRNDQKFNTENLLTQLTIAPNNPAGNGGAEHTLST
jgi:hypothetical protein